MMHGLLRRTDLIARGLCLVPVLAAAACSAPSSPEPAAPPAVAAPARAPITFAQLLARPRAKAAHRIAYGPDPLQFGELWLPEGRGPHPVVVLIHGGCWRADLPGLELMDYMAEDLRRSGAAVWNIEYRRLGETGSAYPDIFADVGRAVDHLRALAPQHRLNSRRVVFSGHSAGGQLALWAAARPRLPRASPLFAPNPLRPRAVVTLAGINDLEAYRASGPAACGGPEVVNRLVNAAVRPAPFADTSPAALLPLRVPQAVVSGALDKIVPSRFGADYAAAAARAGDRTRHIDLAGAGHFELIDPTSAAWPQVEREIMAPLHR
jgi:acetyl esterase/lipase